MQMTNSKVSRALHGEAENEAHEVAGRGQTDARKKKKSKSFLRAALETRKCSFHFFSPLSLLFAFLHVELCAAAVFLAANRSSD
jgi:hypothetical protein